MYSAIELTAQCAMSAGGWGDKTVTVATAALQDTLCFVGAVLLSVFDSGHFVALSLIQQQQ